MSNGVLSGPTLEHYQNIANRFHASNELYLLEAVVKRLMITFLLQGDSEEDGEGCPERALKDRRCFRTKRE
jgi:hypothetical protein